MGNHENFRQQPPTLKMNACWRSRVAALHGPTWTLWALLVLAGACPAQAAEPVLKDLQPPGAQRGKTLVLTLKGEGLISGAELVTSLPATISRLAPPKGAERPDTELSFIVQLPDDAPVGLYPVRLRTPDGLSNAMVFSVGDLPEISEKEPNDTPAEAQPITAPVTVNGHLKGPDKDVYRISARALERLVIEVEARRMGSAIDPTIEVLDTSGREIASNDDAPGLGVDARVEVKILTAGTCYVVVHDSKYSEQETTSYRLKVGVFSFAEGIFPLGWQRGKDVEVAFFGGNLAKPARVRPNLAVSQDVDAVPVGLPGPRPLASLPFYFQVSDFAEVLEPAEGASRQLQPSTVVNGRISKPGEVDRYELKVSPGEKWLFDLKAASLGTSQLYGSLTLYDSQGKELSAREVGNGVDPELAFTVPEKVEKVTVAVEDLRGQGGAGYGYRFLAMPGSGDFSLKIVTPYVNVPARGTAAIRVVAERHGYDGPIQLSVPDLPDDVVVSGGNIAAEILNYEGKRERDTLGYLTLTATPGAKSRTFQLTVWGEGASGEERIRRRAKGPGLIFTVNGEDLYTLTGDLIRARPVTMPWLGIGLPASISRPVPAILEVAAQSYIRVVQGMEFPIGYKLVKQAPGMVTTEVGGLELPTIKDLGLERKADTKGSDEGKLVVHSTLDTPLVKFDVVPSATLQIGGKEEEILAPAFTVELVRAYTLALVSDRVELKGGGKVEFSGTVRREPGFAGTVKVRLDDPPDQVSCPAIEVPDGTSEFRLLCEAAAGVHAGEFEVHLVSSATIPGRKDKREYTFPPLTAHMVLSGEKAPQTAANKTP